MEFIDYLDSNIIVCDADGIVTYMNAKAIKSYEADGGAGLIGKNLFDCHKEKSNGIINAMLQTGKPNVYTIEKKGIKKIIYQAPWFVDGAVKGIAEFSFEIPFEMPHFVRE